MLFAKAQSSPFDVIKIVVVQFQIGTQGAKVEMFFAQGVVARQFKQGRNESAHFERRVGDDFHNFNQFDSEQVERQFVQEIGLQQFGNRL